MHLLPDQTLIGQWIIFALVFCVLNFLLFHPLLQTLSLRSTKMEGAAREAVSLTQQADEKSMDYERRLAEARAQAIAKKDAQVREGIKEREILLKEAKSAWEEIIGEVRIQIAGELKNGSLAIKGEANQLAKEIVTKVLT